LSGIFLGALTYKPHFGILFPLALLSLRNCRALGSATLTAVILNMTATTAFGYKGWAIFIDTLLDRNSGLSAINDVELRHQSIYGLLHWAGTKAWISWSIHLAVASVVILAVCLVWARPFPHSLKGGSTQHRVGRSHPLCAPV
jgi:arabinofuranan 3-O-arabinosyltransferase